VAGALSPEEARRERIADGLVEGMRRPWVTGALLAAMLGAHAVTAGVMLSRGRSAAVALGGGRGPNLLERMGAMAAPEVAGGAVWRLVSAVFLHGDGLHLLVNAWALWSLGRVAESAWGGARFAWLFLLSGVAGFALSFAGGNTLSVGASGGVFGLMGALVVFGWRYREDLPQDIGRILRRRILPWVVVNLAIGASLPFIDNLAHVGGLLCGIVLAMVVGNRIVPGEESHPAARAAMAAAVGAAALAAAWKVARGWG
jgi:rhomboid protease GluP